MSLPVRACPPAITRTEWNKLVQHGVINFNTAFPAPITGQLFYRSDQNKIYFWNGSNWILVTSTDLGDTTGDLPISSIVDIPVTPPTFSLSNGYVDDGQKFRCWVYVAVSAVANAIGYVIEFRPVGYPSWGIMHVDAAGTYATYDLEEATLYEFRCAAVSKLGNPSYYSGTQEITTRGSLIALANPSSITATAIMAGVIISWTDLGLKGESYNVYKGTTSDPDASTLLGTTIGTVYTWRTVSPSDYVLQYFWVRTVTKAGVISVAWPTEVSATPVQAVSTDIGDTSIISSKLLDSQIINRYSTR
jgi:hypothetical protein